MNTQNRLDTTFVFYTCIGGFRDLISKEDR